MRGGWRGVGGRGGGVEQGREEREKWRERERQKEKEGESPLGVIETTRIVVMSPAPTVKYLWDDNEGFEEIRDIQKGPGDLAP